MSLQAMAWAVEYQDLPLDKRTGCVSSSCKLVILALANHADRDGRDCFPSVETIRCFTGLSERMIQYALRALEDHGVIRRTVDPLVRASTIRDGRCRPTSYDIVPPIRGAKSEVRGAPRGAKSKIDSLDQGCMVDDEFAPEPTPKPTPTSKSKPTSKSFSRDKSLEDELRARDVDHPLVEAGLKPDQEQAADCEEVEGLWGQDQALFAGDQLGSSAAKANAERDAEFEEFWTAYPRREKRADARRAWDKAIKKVGVATVMAGVARYVRHLAWWHPDSLDRNKHTAHPSSWLNGERWNDELPPEPTGQRKVSTNGHSSGYKPYTNPVDDSVYHEEIR